MPEIDKLRTENKQTSGTHWPISEILSAKSCAQTSQLYSSQ